MASKETVYLVITKEKAERIITSNVDKCKVYKKDGEKIKIGDQSYPSPTRVKWRVSLYDYKFETERVKMPDGKFETGVLGCKMRYDTRTAGTRARKAVSQYIETG